MASFEELLHPDLSTPPEVFMPVETLPDEEPVVDAVVMTAADQARLITNVYTKMGIFSADQAEQAPELLQPEIEALNKEYPDTEPFVVTNLTDRYGINKLLSNYKKYYEGSDDFALIDPWRQYGIEQLNRRSIGGSHDPAPNTVRGRVSGFVVPGLNILEQRYNAGNQTLLNLTDLILTHAMRLEAGMPISQCSVGFIQLEKTEPNWSVDRPEFGADRYYGVVKITSDSLNLSYRSLLANRVHSSPRVSVGVTQNT